MTLSPSRIEYVNPDRLAKSLAWPTRSELLASRLIAWGQSASSYPGVEWMCSMLAIHAA